MESYNCLNNIVNDDVMEEYFEDCDSSEYLDEDDDDKSLIMEPDNFFNYTYYDSDGNYRLRSTPSKLTPNTFDVLRKMLNEYFNSELMDEFFANKARFQIPEHFDDKYHEHMWEIFIEEYLRIDNRMCMTESLSVSETLSLVPFAVEFCRTACKNEPDLEDLDIYIATMAIRTEAGSDVKKLFKNKWNEEKKIIGGLNVILNRYLNDNVINAFLLGVDLTPPRHITQWIDFIDHYIVDSNRYHSFVSNPENIIGSGLTAEEALSTVPHIAEWVVSWKSKCGRTVRNISLYHVQHRFDDITWNENHKKKV